MKYNFKFNKRNSILEKNSIGLFNKRFKNFDFVEQPNTLKLNLNYDYKVILKGDNLRLFLDFITKSYKLGIESLKIENMVFNIFLISESKINDIEIKLKTYIRTDLKKLNNVSLKVNPIIVKNFLRNFKEKDINQIDLYLKEEDKLYPFLMKVDKKDFMVLAPRMENV